MKGSVTGWTPNRRGSGTYEVNADCTGVVRFSPAPGIDIEARIVIVDDGREIRGINVLPEANFVTEVEKRIHRR